MAGKPEGYQEVAERIHVFYERYPEGSIRTESVDYLQIGGKDAVLIRAAVYRHPDDKLPGTGTAMELIPGKTPFLAGSETENCETSAWGRALASIGLGGKKIASADEVAVKRAEPQKDAITQAQAKTLSTLAADKGWSTAEFKRVVADVMQVPVAKARLVELTPDEATTVKTRLEAKS